MEGPRSEDKDTEDGAEEKKVGEEQAEAGGEQVVSVER